MARKGKQLIPSFGYMRTSSSTNVGEGKDSQKRQRAAIEAYAKSAGYKIVDYDYYDPAVKGADVVTERPGFSTMLDRVTGNGVRTIICESPDRFARDLIVQLTGHDHHHLKGLGIDLVPASALDHFLHETPTAVLVRQVLGAVAQFEKANLVAKLKAARERKAKEHGKCGGRKSYAEANPQLVAKAQELRKQKPELTLRAISAALFAGGYKTPNGVPYSASAVASMLS